MRVAVERMDGVRSAEVSLNEGVVVVTLEPENDVGLDGLRQVIRDRGFTPREADVRARGIPAHRDGRLVFRRPGGQELLDVDSGSEALEALEKRRGETVVVTGRVETDADRMRVTTVEH